MPYFLASSVDSMISSTVIFLSILSRIVCDPLSTPRQRRWQPARRISRRSSSDEQIDARVAAPEEAELALADAAAKLEDALLVGREGVVLDLDHLHREAREHAFSIASST